MQTGEGIIAGGIKRDRSFFERYSLERNHNEFEEAWKQLEAGGSTTDQPLYNPHYEGSSIVTGASHSSPGVSRSHSFAARAGYHLAPQPLSSGRNVFEELGKGFTLLAFGADEQVIKGFQRTAESLQVPLKVVQDTYEGERRAYESGLVLVRPDQYVAWASDESPQDIVGLMQKIVGVA